MSDGVEVMENVNSFKINRPTINWEPKEDITAYELSRAVPVLVNGVSGNPGALVEWIEDLPEGVSRHFRIENG